MIEQFQKILRTPKRSSAETLGMTQDLIICTIEQTFPQTVDIQFIHRIFEQTLGNKAFSSQGQTQITIQQQILLNYQLIKHFIDQFKIHFVSLDVYHALEDQTQRAEATIRSHIKIQHQMKMMIDYLQCKIWKIQRQLANINQSPQYLRRQIQILQNRESTLQRQKINLIKKNENLLNQLQQLKRDIERLGQRQPSIKGSTIFKKYINQGEMSTKLKLFSDKMALIDSKSVKLQQNSDQKQKNDKQKQLYRMNGHDYDLTQKKRSGYLPLGNF